MEEKQTKKSYALVLVAGVYSIIILSGIGSLFYAGISKESYTPQFGKTDSICSHRKSDGYEKHNFKVKQIVIKNYYSEGSQLSTSIWEVNEGPDDLLWNSFDDFDKNNIESLSVEKRKEAENLIIEFRKIYNK